MGAKAYWFKNGINTDNAGVTAIAHAIMKMRAGMIDPTDVEIQIGRIEIDRPEETNENAGHRRHDDPDWFLTDDVLGLSGRSSGATAL